MVKDIECAAMNINLRNVEVLFSVRLEYPMQ